MASERAKKGGGQERSIAEDASNLTAGVPGQVSSDGVAEPPTATSTGIQRGTNADWFGPLNPMQPTAPPEVAGRRLDFPSGYNLQQQPKAYQGIPFGVLRNMADSYDLLRTVIETRKDQMERMKWSIRPRDAKKAKNEKDVEQDGRIATLEKFFLRPDRRHFWGEWLRMVLEDLLVLDAPTIYKRRTLAGELYGLEIIDGATIKLVIDDWGRTPEPPLAAYQQALKGFPAVNYSTADILYRPRNVRAHQVYGYSPVEQIVMTIQIALKRQIFQLEFFTSGNMPEALIGVPETWTPDQITQFQDWFDNMLSGNLDQRRQAKFVPSAVGKTYIPTKETELFGKAEEWLARMVCFAFSISPQPFLNMMNRATAESAQEVAVLDGLVPLMAWVKNLIDTIILDEFDIHDLEFVWVEEDELDPKVESEIVMRYVEGGLLSMNQGLKRIGEDPRPEPEFDRPMMKAATGYVPVVETAEEKQAKLDAAAAIAGGEPGEGPPGLKKPGALGAAESPPAVDAVAAIGADKSNAAPKDASMEKGYNPDQPRDEDGKWSEGGGGGGGGGGGKKGGGGGKRTYSELKDERGKLEAEADKAIRAHNRSAKRMNAKGKPSKEMKDTYHRTMADKDKAISNLREHEDKWGSPLGYDIGDNSDLIDYKKFDQDNGLGAEDDDLQKRHDSAIREVERVAMRDPKKDDAVVTFGATADKKTIESVLNLAAKVEPNWR